MSLSETDQVNIRNTRLWVRMNEDTRAEYHRKTFTKKHGGCFVKVDKQWKWIKESNTVPYEHSEEFKNFKLPEPVIKIDKKRCFIYTKNDKEVEIENLYQYCQENDLNRSAMYDLVIGKRKSYKGFRFVRKEE